MIQSLWEFDLQGFRAINQGWRSPIADVWFTFFSYFGLGQSLILVVLAYPALAAWREGGSYREYVKLAKFRVARLSALVVLSGTILAQGFKQTIDRDRPSQLADAIRQEEHRLSSFPSGHTTTAFALGFYFLILTWGTPKAGWGWLAMFLAANVGISRIYRGVHWPTDVLAGVFAGLVAAILIRWYEAKRGLIP